LRLIPLVSQTELAPRAERNEEFLKELEGVMCLLVYGATGTGTAAGAGKEKGKDTNKVDSTTKTDSKEREREREKEKEAKGKEKGVDPKVEIDAPPSLLDLLSMQHRALTASVSPFPLPSHSILHHILSIATPHPHP
jgi:hypothetical protein